MASTSTSAPAAAATPRFDFYQTDTVVTLSIFVKSASTETLSVDIAERSLHVKATSSTTGSEYVLRIDPLFAPIDPSSSDYKVLSTKIDVILHKANPGVRWLSLQAGPSATAVTSAVTPSYSASQAAAGQTQTSTPRAKSKWDSFNPDADAASAPGDAGEADINAFFQKLYADADEDTRRAMMKSYQESGGTTLSTDWSKVGKGKVETQPPDGMEAKEW